MDEAIEQLFEKLRSEDRARQAGQFWGPDRIDKPQAPHALARGRVEAGNLYYWRLGTQGVEDDRLMAELIDLRILGLAQFPRLKKKHAFMASISRGFRRTTFEATWEQPLELGITLMDITTRWSRFVGQRCLLEPREHVGRKVEIAWRRSDHPRDCELIAGSGCERRIVANTHYRVTLNATPDLYLRGANPVIIFHAEKDK